MTRRDRAGWAILEALDEAVITADIADRVTYLNAAAEMLLERSASDAVGLSLEHLFSTRPGAGVGCDCVLLPRNGGVVPVELRRTPLRDERGRAAGTVIACRSVTPGASTPAEATPQPNDELTGLPTRHVLRARLTEAMADATRETKRVAVCFVDVDGLKRINDTFGHLAGDWVLTLVAERLTHIVRSSDTVARIGGDEFVVVLPQVERRVDAEALGEAIAHAVARPVCLSDRWVDVSASVGLALYPDQGRDVETLLAVADAEMYVMKRARHREQRCDAVA